MRSLPLVHTSAPAALPPRRLILLTIQHEDYHIVLESSYSSTAALEIMLDYGHLMIDGDYIESTDVRYVKRHGIFFPE